MSTRDLFDSPSGHASPLAFARAFEEWVLGERRAKRLTQDSSIAVYEAMWTALAMWSVGEGLSLDTLSAPDLDRFLQSRGTVDDISNRYSWRLLRLVDRVMAHRARRGDVAHNQAAAQLLESRADLKYANAADKAPPPSYLVASEAKRLVTYLSAVRPGRSTAPHTWNEVRNRASVALMLGSGLTPGEVRALALRDVITEGGRTKDLPWKLAVAGHTDTPARETPIAAWAGQLLQFWLRTRTEQRIEGPWLFPSTRTGKPWGKVAQYNATREVLQAAGIDDLEGGSFRLRHTFALRQLRRGKSPDDVALWLGVSDPSVMARYRRILMAPVDVV